MNISPHTFEGQATIRHHIAEYVKKNGVTSLRKIATHVHRQTGINVSPSTVGRLLRKLNLADRPKISWEPKHAPK